MTWRRMRTKTSIGVAMLLSLCGCKLGPNYQRPALDVPGQHRGTAPDLAQQPAGVPFGEMTWPIVYQDPTLQALLKEALTNNYDIRIAATRILQAEAELGVTRANQFPTVGGVGSIQNEQSPPLLRGAPWIDTLGLQMNYIVDFWGQYRRATEAARANLLGTRYAQNVVQITLISEIASDYFLLRQYDAQLEISEQTVVADKDILRLNIINFKGGEYSLTDVDQALLLVQQAQAEVISLNQLIPQTENALSILLGRNPGPINRGLNLVDQPHLPDVPPGLPSTLLERRPDVREAEEALVAANANVGVAKANFFPQFSITGSFGASSTALTSFLQGPATFWTVGGQLAQPIFEGGRITSGYRLAWAQRDQAELQYKQTVQQAFGDVSNSLYGYYQSRQFRIKIEEQTATYKESAHLANVRFTGGYTSFLEVLTIQQQYFTSELNLMQAWYTELQNYDQLYLALGGGWQP
jgi:multidrug efflux system outer membrane protein